MTTPPHLERRPAVKYIGIRSEAAADQLPIALPPLFGELWTWLERHGIAPVGVPFVRYCTVDRSGAVPRFGFEVGFPVRPGALCWGRRRSIILRGSSVPTPGCASGRWAQRRRACIVRAEFRKRPKRVVDACCNISRFSTRNKSLRPAAGSTMGTIRLLMHKFGPAPLCVFGSCGLART